MNDKIQHCKCLSRSQTGSCTVVSCNRVLIHKAAVPDSDIESKHKLQLQGRVRLLMIVLRDDYMKVNIQDYIA